MQAPPYLKDSGYWYSSIDNSMIGWVDDFTEYEYTPVHETITKSEFIDRVMDMHSKYPMVDGKSTPERELNPVPLTDQEVLDLVTNWYDYFVNLNQHIPTSPSQTEFEALKEKKKEEAFNAMMKRMENASVDVKIASAGNANLKFGCDKITQENIIAFNVAVSRNNPSADNVLWMPKGGTTPTTLTKNELGEINDAILTKKEEYYQNYFTHKAAIMSMIDYEELVNYDYTTGYE